MSRSARVLVCSLGVPPQEIRMPSDPGLPGHLGGLMDLIGGPVESVPLDGGVHLWCSVGGTHPGSRVPLNRCVPRDPQLPPGFEDADLERLAAQMAIAAHLQVHGEFVLARGNAGAGLVDMTDSDVERWTRWFEVDAQVRRRK
jgi:hypothetical protein